MRCFPVILKYKYKKIRQNCKKVSIKNKKIVSRQMAGGSDEPGIPTIYIDDIGKRGDLCLLGSKLQALSTLPFSEVTDPAEDQS